MQPENASARQRLGQLLRLWLVLTVSFVVVKLALDLFIAGVIDLRRVALWQLPAVPLGQTVVYWLIVRGGRSSSSV